MLVETLASPPCLPRSLGCQAYAGTVHLSARRPGPRGGPSWTAPAGREATTGRWLAPAGRGGSQAHVALPATCGELVQGTLDGIPCLVSCPIGRYSMAEVRLRPGPGWDVPPDAAKATAALRDGLACLDRPGSGGRLRLVTDLPRGRGYVSNTADIGATLFALGRAIGQPLASDEAAGLAVGVEPSDSTLFPGLTLFDHQGGSFHESLGPAPSLSVVVLDPGSEVDTLAFNRLDHRGILRRLAPEHRRAFALLRDGLEQRDWEALGEATTLSACAHQAILPDPLVAYGDPCAGIHEDLLRR